MRDGGEISLLSLAEALAGERLGAQLRRTLQLRNRVTFRPGRGGARFENDGAEAELRLKSFTLKVPAHLRGRAEPLEDGGVVLRFERGRALAACKALVCTGIERIELTRRRVFVGLEGGSFDQSFDLQ